MAQRIWMFAPCKHHKCKCEDGVRPCHFQSPQSLKQGNDGDLTPYSSIISELRSTKFSMSWMCLGQFTHGLIHGVGSNGWWCMAMHGRQTRSQFPLYMLYIVSKHWRQMPTDYLVVLPKFHKANRFSHDLNCQKGLSDRRRTRAFGRLKGSRWLQNPRWFPLKKWWDTIRSYMNTRAGRKPEWCLKQRKNIDMICANQCSSTKCILPYLERILHSIGKEMVTLTALTLDFGQWELPSDSS